MKSLFCRRKRVLAFFMVLVLLVTTLIPQVSNVTKAKADEITGFNNSNMPVDAEMLRWDMGSKYGYGSEYIEVGNLVKQDEAIATIVELGGDDTPRYVTRLKGATKSPWIVYKEVGVIVENGVQKKVDIKVTVTDWEMDSTIEGDYFIFSEGALWVTMRGVRWVDMKYEFFPSGTDYSNESALESQKIEVNGVFSQEDLDISQYFLFNEDESGVSQISNNPEQYKINEQYDKSDHITFENDVTVDGKVYDKVQASRTQLDGDTVGHGFGTDTWVSTEIAGATLSGYVSLRFKSDTVKFRFGVRDDDIYSGYIQHVYGIIPYSIASFEAPKPLKYVIDDTELDANGNKTVKPATEVYKKDGDTSVTYVIDVFLPRSLRNNYNKFVLTDVLDDVYEVSNKASISIYQDSDYAVTGKQGLGKQIYGSGTNYGWFTVEKSSSNGTLKFTATNAALNNASFFGHSYQFVITTKIDKSSSRYSDWIPSDAEYLKIPNVATSTTGVWTVNQTTGVGSYQDEIGSTNEVMVHYTEPVLEIIKKVKDNTGDLVDGVPNVEDGEKPTDYIVGDEVEFEIIVANTNPIAEVYQLGVWDVLPKNIELISYNIDFYNNGVKVGSQGHNGTNGWGSTSLTTMASSTIDCGAKYSKRLGYGTITETATSLNGSGSYVKMTVKGKISYASNGLNVATAKDYYGYSVTDNAVVQAKDFVPVLDVTKNIFDDNASVENEASVRITIKQADGNARKDQIAEISEIFDTMYCATINDGYTTNNRVFELASSVKLYKVSTSGIKTEIFIGSHEDYYFTYVGRGSGTSYDDNFGFHYYFNEGVSDSGLSEYNSYLPLAYGEKLYIEYDIIPHTIPEDLYNPTNISNARYYYDRPYYNIVGVNQGGINEEVSWWEDGVQKQGDVDSNKSANYVARDTIEVNVPHLNISKTSDKNVYEYGETAHYTVTLEQTNPDAYVSVLFTDYFMDDIFASTGLDSNNVPYTWYEEVLQSIKITDLAGNDRTSEFDFNFYKYNDASLPAEVEGYSPGPVLMATLKDGYEFNIGMGNGYIITYDVPLTLSCFKDVTLTNRADLTARLAESVYAENTIQVVTPKIDIVKTVSAQQSSKIDNIRFGDFYDEVIVEKGNRVWYKLNISLETANEEGLVRILTIEDEIPEGMTLDASNIYMFDSQGQNITNEDDIFTTTTGGFIIEMARAYDTNYTVYYSAKVNDDALDSSAIVNTAYASARHADTVSDTATVNVRPKPVLSIDKYSDKTNYTLGETGHYTIEVTNTVENSIARNIEVFDVIEDSVTVKESTIKATLIKSGSTTGESWLVQPDTYDGTVLSVGRAGTCIDFYIGGDTGSAVRPNLEYGDKLVVEYDVVYNEAGDVVNDAEAYSSNADYVSTTNTVNVKDPSAELTINKYAHKNSFVVGESPYYTLEISQVKEDAVAENITIVDYFDMGIDIEN